MNVVGKFLKVYDYMGRVVADKIPDSEEVNALRAAQGLGGHVERIVLIEVREQINIIG